MLNERSRERLNVGIPRYRLTLYGEQLNKLI